MRRFARKELFFTDTGPKGAMEEYTDILICYILYIYIYIHYNVIRICVYIYIYIYMCNVMSYTIYYIYIYICTYIHTHYIV